MGSATDAVETAPSEPAAVELTLPQPASAQSIASADPNGFEELPDEAEWAASTFEPTVSADAIDLATIRISRQTADEPAAHLPPREFGTIANPEARLDVGRWCEELVYKMLCAASAEFTEVEWMNQHGESCLPYDFKVVQNGQPRILEVKGTPSRHKDTVYLSPAEWCVMFEQGPRYSLYRVLGAENSDPKVKITDHPSGQIEKGQLLPDKIELIL